MKCDEAINLALLKESGEASPEECARLETHLQRCTTCCSMLSDHHETTVLYKVNRPTPSAPASIRDSIVESAQHEHKERTILRFSGLLAAAAAAVITLVLVMPGSTPTTANTNFLPVEVVWNDSFNDTELLFDADLTDAQSSLDAFDSTIQLDDTTNNNEDGTEQLIESLDDLNNVLSELNQIES